MSAPSVPAGRLDREARAGTAVETRGLTKHYGAVRALTDVDVTIRTGEVYGLVGRNGAGKTTLMRLLLGLVRPTAGTARVLGRDAAAGTSDVGALVESPALYPHLSGRNNLRLLARYCGASDADVRAALDQVGMGARAGSRFSTYSLGMRQRMGVAAALLGEPRLLVLDEPTNGLDPIAMTEIRELIGALRRRGHTVLLSSHLLDEVEQVCDRIGVLADGRLVAEGTIAEIHALADGPARLVVTAQPVDTALAVLRRHPGTGEVRRDGERLEVELGAAAPAEITGALVRAGVEVSDVHVRHRSLQDVFAGLTESDAGVGAA